MNEERFFFYNDGSGKWESYDSTYDITIHCRNQDEQDMAVELLRKTQYAEKEVMKAEDAARILKEICKKHPVRCNGCPFDGGGYNCKLESPPDEWNL